MLILGIDPGVGGAITELKENEILVSSKMPDTYYGINHFFEKHKGKEVIAFIERVGSMPSDVNDGKFMRMDALIANKAVLIMSLVVNRIPFVEVSPITWQTMFRLRNKKGEKLSYTERKNRNWMYAQKYNPDIKKYASDSLIIAIYGMNIVNQDLFSNTKEQAENNIIVYPVKTKKKKKR